MKDLRYVPIQAITIPPHREIPFDLFVNYKEQFVLYSPKGEALSEEKLLKIRNQNITRLYISVDHEPEYNVFVEEVIKDALARKSYLAAPEVQEDITVARAADQLAEIHKGKSIENNVKASMASVFDFYKMFKKNPNSINRLYGRQLGSIPKIIQHCVDVSMLLTGWAAHIEMPEEDVVQLGVAAILHDIGMREFTEEETFLFTKPFKNFKKPEKKFYMSHIDKAEKLIKNFDFINDNIRMMIKYHEENCNGTGPLKIEGLTEHQEMLSMVNRFDKYRMMSAKDPGKAFLDLKVLEYGFYSPTTINSFGKYLVATKFIELDPVETLKLEDKD